MSQMDIFDDANRDSGNWLPNVNLCPHRLLPCGNVWCADEAMRAAEMQGGIVAIFARQQAESHAFAISEQCAAEGHLCPLQMILNTVSPQDAIKRFSTEIKRRRDEDGGIFLGRKI